eukprot:ctg_20.g5
MWTFVRRAWRLQRTAYHNSHRRPRPLDARLSVPPPHPSSSVDIPRSVCAPPRARRCVAHATRDWRRGTRNVGTLSASTLQVNRPSAYPRVQVPTQESSRRKLDKVQRALHHGRRDCSGLSVGSASAGRAVPLVHIHHRTVAAGARGGAVAAAALRDIGVRAVGTDWQSLAGGYDVVCHPSGVRGVVYGGAGESPGAVCAPVGDPVAGVHVVRAHDLQLCAQRRVLGRGGLSLAVPPAADHQSLPVDYLQHRLYLSVSALAAAVSVLAGVAGVLARAAAAERRRRALSECQARGAPVAARPPSRCGRAARLSDARPVPLLAASELFRRADDVVVAEPLLAGVRVGRRVAADATAGAVDRGGRPATECAIPGQHLADREAQRQQVRRGVSRLSASHQSADTVAAATPSRESDVRCAHALSAPTSTARHHRRAGRRLQDGAQLPFLFIGEVARELHSES